MANKISESSISLRLITSAMAVVGILAACQLAQTPPALAMMAIAGTIIGSYISYWRRDANNTWIKWLLAVGVLVVLGVFVDEIISRIQASIADARVPLTNMLIALQGLHSFDLPRRRDLNVSALVGLTLLSSAATLSSELTFGLYLGAFICFGFYMLYLDCISRTIEQSSQETLPEKNRSLGKGAGVSTLLLLSCLPVAALAIFWIMPRADIGLLHNIRVSIHLNLPMLGSNHIRNPMLTHTRRRDGSLAINPLAYFGFDEDLDLNYRGKLSDQVVMKISSSQGEFWRAMAFDTYNGHSWTMSSPRKTYDRVAVYGGSSIPLSPVPSMYVPPTVETMELSQVFHMEVDQPNLIPAASVPHLIYFPTNSVQIDDYGALRSPVLMEKDMVYTVFSNVPTYLLEQLRKTRVNPRGDSLLSPANYLQLPPELPQEVRELAAKVAGHTGNRFARAERIDRFLKRKYKYDLNISPTPAGTDVVSEFLLRRKRGYCEHFASAFVVMCRCQGIPARLVTGFMPGQYNPFTGLWEVRMTDAHAWAEVLTYNWGWVTFDPTADGVPPAYQGKSAGCSLKFLTDRMQSIFLRVIRQPEVKASLKQTMELLKPLVSAIVWLSFFLVSAWPQLASAVLLVAAGVFAIKVVPRVLSRRQDRRVEIVHKATQEYLKLCRELESFSIVRRAQDTASDLTASLHKNLPDELKLDAEFPLLISRFMDDYSRARFHFEAPDDNLAHIAGRIREKIQTYNSISPGKSRESFANESKEINN